MPGTTLQIGCQTLVDEASKPFDFIKFSRISNPGFDTVEFNNNIKLARERLAKGEVFADTKPEDKIAKILDNPPCKNCEFSTTERLTGCLAVPQKCEKYQEYSLLCELIKYFKTCSYKS